jgi:putative hydrolase of the HAD superfamily
MTRPIDAVLFDYGGVITAFSPFTTMGAMGADAGVSPEVVLETMMGDYHQDTDHVWHRVERGEAPITDWLTAVIPALAEFGIELDLAALAGMFKTLGIHDHVVAKVAALKADGYKTAIVTNNVKEGSAEWRSMLDLDALFDVVIDSSAVGVRKPNPAIYRLALEELGGVEPARAVFLDDHEGNIAGARAVGLHAVLVGPDPQPALDELDRILAGT